MHDDNTVHSINNNDDNDDDNDSNNEVIPKELQSHNVEGP